MVACINASPHGKVIGLQQLGEGNRGKWTYHGLVQDCSNSIVLAMELLQSCTKPSISSIQWDQNNGHHFEENIFKCFFYNEIQTSVMFGLKYIFSFQENLLENYVFKMATSFCRNQYIKKLVPFIRKWSVHWSSSHAKISQFLTFLIYLQSDINPWNQFTLLQWFSTNQWLLLCCDL